CRAERRLTEAGDELAEEDRFNTPRTCAGVGIPTIAIGPAHFFNFQHGANSGRKLLTDAPFIHDVDDAVGVCRPVDLSNAIDIVDAAGEVDQVVPHDCPKFRLGTLEHDE